MACSASDVAQRISPDPTQPCLLSLGLGTSSSSSYTADYTSLAIAPCAALNEAQTYCLTVYVTASTSTPLVVGLALLSSRRRLLSDRGAWAHEPCRSLMAAEGALGPTDTLARDDCRRWRTVGALARSRFNLSSPAESFATWQGIGEALASSDARTAASWLPFLLAHWPPAAPVLAAARVSVSRMTRVFGRGNRTVANRTRPLPVLKELVPGAPLPTPLNVTAAGARRLLSWKDSLAEVQSFSVSIAQGQAATLPVDIQQQWSKGPFFWPPSYSYRNSNDTCLVAEVVYNVSYFTFKATANYYTGTYTIPTVSRSFATCLPEPSALDVHSFALGPFGETVKSFFVCDFETVQLCSGFRRSLGWSLVVVACMWAAISIAARQISVPYVDFALAALYLPMVLLYSMGVSPICVPMVPTCFLQEITGILESLLPGSITWSSLLQRWPGCLDGATPLLQNGLVNVNLLRIATPSTPSCFVPCTDDPFNFDSWQDSVAWILVEAGIPPSWIPDWAGVVVAYLPQSIQPYFDPRLVASAYGAKAPYTAWPEMLSAQRVCFGLTAINLVALVLCAAAVVTVAVGLLAVPLLALQLVLAFLVVLLQFVHTK